MILSFDPAKIWCLCFDFHLDPAIEINFSLKSELHVMFLLRFLLRSVIFAQIWVWWVDFQLRSGENPVTIGENPVIDCQYEADRPDRCPPESDPTRPEVVYGRRRVVQSFTRWKQVGCGLGINPTRTDPWTPLMSALIKCVCVSIYIKRKLSMLRNSIKGGKRGVSIRKPE